MGCESTKRNALVIEEKVWWDVNLSNKMSGYCPTFTDAAREVKVKANTANFKSELLYYLSVKLRLRLWQVAFSFVSFLFRFHAFWRNVIIVYVRYIEPNHKCWLLYRKQYICILFTDPHVLKLHTISTVNAETPYDFLGLPKCAKRFRTFVPWD